MTDRRGTGCFIDVYDPMDAAYRLDAHLANNGDDFLDGVPSSDLSVWVDRVRDQGSTQSCVGHAITSALHIRACLTGKPVAHGSPLAAYTLGRSFDVGNPNIALVDIGSRPRSVVQALKLFGIPAETDWPLTVDSINTRPAFGQIRKGIAYRAGDYYWADDDDNRVDTVRRALANNYPVCCSLVADDQIFEPKDNTIDVPVGKSKGRHYCTIVGYNNGLFRMLNSWGDEWGDRGYAWITPARLNDSSTKSILAVGVSEL